MIDVNPSGGRPRKGPTDTLSTLQDSAPSFREALSERLNLLLGDRAKNTQVCALHGVDYVEARPRVKGGYSFAKAVEGRVSHFGQRSDIDECLNPRCISQTGHAEVGERAAVNAHFGAAQFAGRDLSGLPSNFVSPTLKGVSESFGKSEGGGAIFFERSTPLPGGLPILPDGDQGRATDRDDRAYCLDPRRSGRIPKLASDAQKDDQYPAGSGGSGQRRAQIWSKTVHAGDRHTILDRGPGREQQKLGWTILAHLAPALGDTAAITLQADPGLQSNQPRTWQRPASFHDKRQLADLLGPFGVAAVERAFAETALIPACEAAKTQRYTKVSLRAYLAKSEAAAD